MLRAITYGSDLNMAYPPRPTDSNDRLEAGLNVKLRVKSVTTPMIDMPEAPICRVQRHGWHD